MYNGSRSDFWRWTLVGFAVLAAVFGLSTARTEWFAEPPKPIGDGLCYESVAFSLYSGYGFREDYGNPEWRELYEGRESYHDFLATAGDRDLPATGRPPLLPLVIAGIYWLFGRNAAAFMAVRLFSAICLALAGGLASGLSAHLLSRCYARPRWLIGIGAIMTIAMAASQRTLRDYTSDFLTEPLALLLMQVFIVQAVLLTEESSGPKSTNRTLASMFSMGVTIGLMVLARSLFVFWVPGLLGLLYASICGDHRQRLRSVLTAAATFVVICSPWWIHNCVVLHRWMPLGTQGSIALVGGYCEEALNNGGNWTHAPELQLRRELEQRVDFQVADDTSRELMMVDAAKAKVWTWIGGNWQHLPSLACMRAISHWNPYSGRALLWKLLIFIGTAWALRNVGRVNWWLVGLPVLSTAVIMILYEAGGRFLVPLYGLLFTLGGLSVAGWLGSVVAVSNHSHQPTP